MPNHMTHIRVYLYEIQQMGVRTYVRMSVESAEELVESM